MNTSSPVIREESIFGEALGLAAGAPRDAYLDAACAGDAELRRGVTALLLAHERAGGILESPISRLGPAAGVAPALHGPGSTIGRYRLLEQIGEGGMGTVFMAEQTHPVRRKVALKVIKAGMDTGQVVARFEAERQALAMMDHPNIARVLDAGATDSGRPYFVMELVAGVPITEYCDAMKLSPRERLGLFGQVCQAVQHAHTKGVIHRDLKPSNVLVTMHDDRAVPKVIDFGIAKATQARLTGRTLFTEFKQFVGTPQYTSPEQAQMGGLDVDTRADVYSLGVLLYELLTGTTPLDPQALRGAGLDEMQRLIRDADAVPPSARLSTLGRALVMVAASRRADPRRLPQAVRGELDWIVMKCLEKDRARRYETAAGLAADVRRHLDGEVVLARPATAGYRLRKFARRHRVALSVAGAAVAALLVMVGGLAASNVLIRREQARTRAHQQRAERSQRLAEGRARQIAQDLERLHTANSLLERSRWYFGERRWDDANASLTRAINLRPEDISPWLWRADLYVHLGLWDLAAADFREVELREPDDALRWYQRVLLCRAAGDVEGCRRTARRMRDRFEGTLDNMFVHEVLRAQFLASSRPGGTPGADDRPEAARLVELAREVVLRHPGSAYALFILGSAHHAAGEHGEAARRLEEALAASDWEVRLLSQPVLAMAYHRLGRPDDARRALADAAATLDRWTAARYAAGGGDLRTGAGADAVWPGSWWDWLEMDLRCREARLLVEGAAPAADPRVHVLRARSLMGLRWPEKAVPEYAAALSLRPDDAQVRLEAHFAQAYVHIHQGEWAAAAAALAEATHLRPDDVKLWRFLALAHFAAGDSTAHRASCAAMLARFENTGDWGVACSVVHALVVSGNATDPARLLRLADVAATMWHYGTWTRGAALYRAGRHDDAVRCFEAAARTYRPRAWDWCFLAMAHHRLGRPEEARRCLGEAARWIEQADRHEGDDLIGTRPAWGDWHERPVYLLLLREAEELLAGERLPAQPPAQPVGHEGPPPKS